MIVCTTTRGNYDKWIIFKHHKIKAVTKKRNEVYYVTMIQPYGNRSHVWYDDNPSNLKYQWSNTGLHIEDINLFYNDKKTTYKEIVSACEAFLKQPESEFINGIVI